LFPSPAEGEGVSCAVHAGAADVAFLSVFAFAAVAGMMLLPVTGFTMFWRRYESRVFMLRNWRKK
jgi:Na+(H+)/acetate symporter ActP